MIKVIDITKDSLSDLTDIVTFDEITDFKNNGYKSVMFIKTKIDNVKILYSFHLVFENLNKEINQICRLANIPRSDKKDIYYIKF